MKTRLNLLTICCFVLSICWTQNGYSQKLEYLQSNKGNSHFAIGLRAYTPWKVTSTGDSWLKPIWSGFPEFGFGYNKTFQKNFEFGFDLLGSAYILGYEVHIPVPKSHPLSNPNNEVYFEYMYDDITATFDLIVSGRYIIDLAKSRVLLGVNGNLNYLPSVDVTGTVSFESANHQDYQLSKYHIPPVSQNFYLTAGASAQYEFLFLRRRNRAYLRANFDHNPKYKGHYEIRIADQGISGTISRNLWYFSLGYSISFGRIKPKT